MITVLNFTEIIQNFNRLLHKEGISGTGTTSVEGLQPVQQF
jgi:hypothetical protein